MSDDQFEAARIKSNKDYIYKQKSNFNKINQNRWDSGGSQTDWQEHGMNIHDIGYTGDGF